MARRDARRETSAGGVVVRRNDTLRYLLILDGHGNWGFPKGHVQRGETLEATARREIAEETGLDNLVHRAPIGAIAWRFRSRGQVIHKTCHFFLFESPEGDVRPQLDEGITECRWLGEGEARATLTYDSAREVLERAVTALAG